MKDRTETASEIAAPQEVDALIDHDLTRDHEVHRKALAALAPSESCLWIVSTAPSRDGDPAAHTALECDVLLPRFGSG